MKIRSHILQFVLYLLCFPLAGIGQDIVLDDSLASHAAKYDVNMGGFTRKGVAKMKFENYQVIDGKSKSGVVEQKSNFWHTKGEMKRTERFSFVLSHTSGREAEVYAAFYSVNKWIGPYEVSPSFSVGEDYQCLLDSSNFAATIILNHDTAATWHLYMIQSENIDKGYLKDAFLTNGVRVIDLYTVTSNRTGQDKRVFPATGYELAEGNQAIGAVQYFGGGAFGLNKNIIWLHQDLDPDMQLMLAAAMTAVLQGKLNALVNIE